MITFTLDLEDHRSDHRYEKRYPDIVRQLLVLLEQHQARGTFFVVGKVTENDPELIKEIANQGHELAFHSYDHRQLHLDNFEQFKQETDKGKKLLEDLSGQAVIGYRAPVFSLTKNTLWALDSLKESGFLYSSSVLPAANPLNGIESAPTTPFHWPNGLLEIPVPVMKFGPVNLPYLGGVYLRYLPAFFLMYLINKNQKTGLWTYCHPYDFDPDELFFMIKGASFLTSLILWFNRKNTKKKISLLLSHNLTIGEAMTFSEQFHKGLFNTAPVFEL